MTRRDVSIEPGNLVEGIGHMDEAFACLSSLSKREILMILLVRECYVSMTAQQPPCASIALRTETLTQHQLDTDDSIIW